MWARNQVSSHHAEIWTRFISHLNHPHQFLVCQYPLPRRNLRNVDALNGIVFEVPAPDTPLEERTADHKDMELLSGRFNEPVGDPDEILELDRGQGIPFKGNYTSWLEQKQERMRHQEKSESERQKTLERELEWIRMSPKARRAKGKARITAYEALLDQESQKRREDLEIPIPPGPRLGTPPA